MPNLTTIEKDFFYTDERVALVQGNLFRNHGNLSLATGESLYSAVNLSQTAKFNLSTTAWSGNFTVTVYEGGVITGGVPASLPVNVNRLSDKPFQGEVEIALSGSGGSIDLTGATQLFQVVVDESASNKGGSGLELPFMILDPELDYTFVLQNDNTGSNSIQYDSQYVFFE